MKAAGCCLFAAFMFFTAAKGTFGQMTAVEKLSVTFVQSGNENLFVRDNRIFMEGWAGKPEVNFWKKVVTLPPDSGFLNIHAGRKIVSTLPTRFWEMLSTQGKDSVRDWVRQKYNLSPEDKVVFTAGKSDFYDFGHVISLIPQAFKIFEDQGVPGFYAQSILLIECPGTLKKSNAGAAGHFQLMPSVAVAMGLKVNKYVDERNDFEKCAEAAAKFIRKVCIPRAEQLLQERGIYYKPSDLWFKLLVLHVYHAGSGNVAAALDAIPAEKRKGNPELIHTLWQTKAASFGNASQNYSQIALANNVLLYEFLESRCAELTVSPYTYSSL